MPIEEPELPPQAPPPINSPEAIERALAGNTIAIVGLSSQPESSSYYVASYLQEHGYRIIPVNQRQQSILGETAYPSLRDIPEEIPAIAQEAHEIGAKVLWMPLGIANARAGQWARAAGMTVVMNRCMKMEHMARHGHAEE